MKKAVALPMHKGHRCFEFDLETKLIREADVEEITIKDEKGNDATLKKVKRRRGCLYEVALNAKNADRIFIKRIQEMRQAISN